MLLFHRDLDKCFHFYSITLETRKARLSILSIVAFDRKQIEKTNATKFIIGTKSWLLFGAEREACAERE